MGSIRLQLLGGLSVIFIASFARAEAPRCIRQDAPPPEVRRDALRGKPLYAAARAALVRESRKTGLATSDETRELVDLFCAAMQDRQLNEADRISTRVVLRNRLLAIERGLKAEVKTLTKAAAKSGRSAGRGVRSGGSASAAKAADQASSHDRGAAGGAAIADNARQLIELIERTISPDSWEVNGGEGTIFYYSPLQVLVVRNTAEVHEGVGRAAGAIRP